MSVPRSFRLEDRVYKQLETLPRRSANALVNHLLKLFFTDPEVRAKVARRDRRFTRPLQITDLIAPSLDNKRDT